MGAMDTYDPTTRELDEYLDALGRADSYRLLRSLSSGGAEEGSRTDLVAFSAGGGASLGPFVRKRIPLAAGLGNAYEAIFRAQRSGRRFTHLPRVVECYKTSDELVVVSEFVEGETLDELVGRLEREGVAPAAIAERVFPALCDAVSELHGVTDPPIIHRDLKPRNVIVADQGLFLIDFGIARCYREGASSDTVRLGTRAYAPPEQFGYGQTSTASDVYALGMLLAFMLMGREPEGRPGRDDLASRAGSALAACVLKATAFDPEDRYASARELRDAFLAALSGRGATASSMPPAPMSPEMPAAPVPPAASIASAGRGSRAGIIAGRVLNAILILIALGFLAAAIQGIGPDPAPEMADKPFWYRVAVSFGFTIPLLWGVIYLLLDKRDLYRLVPALAGRRYRDDLKVWGLYLLVAFLVLLLICTITGV